MSRKKGKWKHGMAVILGMAMLISQVQFPIYAKAQEDTELETNVEETDVEETDVEETDVEETNVEETDAQETEQETVPDMLISPNALALADVKNTIKADSTPANIVSIFQNNVSVSGNTITLLNGFVVDTTIVFESGTWTLDMNNRYLYGMAAADDTGKEGVTPIEVNGANLTIKNGTILGGAGAATQVATQTGGLGSKGGSAVVVSSGNLLIKGGTFYGGLGGKAEYANQGEGGAGGDAVLVHGGAVTIESGNFIGATAGFGRRVGGTGGSGIYTDGGTVSIQGGSFSGGTGADSWGYNGAGGNGATAAGGTILVSGGTFAGGRGGTGGQWEQRNGNLLETRDGGTLKIVNPYTLSITNTGKLKVGNKGTLIIEGRISISGSGALINDGGGTVVNQGRLTNDGTITNNGTFENYGTLDGSGTMTPKLTTVINGENKEIGFTTSCDLSRLFVIPAGAGRATYSLETGGIGAGVIKADGKTLGVTKAGTFVIKVQTEATNFYNAGEKIITLTVSKDDQSAPEEAPAIAGHTENSITLTAVSPNANGAAAEYSMDGINWQAEPTFSALSSDTEYTFTVRYAATEDGNYNPSPASAELKSKIPHTFTNYVSNNDATCMADGTKTAVCDLQGCTATDTKTDTGSMHPHTMTHTEAVEATCIAKGNVEYWTCSECNKNYDSADGGNVIADVVTEIDPDNHDLVHHEKKEPTYTEIGWKAYDTCSRCDYTTYEELPMLKDDIAPTGTIKVKENQWSSFINTITFGIFCKDKFDVTITAEDKETGVKSVEYNLSETAISEEDIVNATEWKTYSAFSLAEEGKYIVYAKITDNSGNVVYISSDGMVVDKTNPIIKGITDGSTYCCAQTFTVDEEYKKSVTVNGTEVTATDGTYALAATGETYEIVVTDKAGNTAVVTVTVNDGHTFTTYVPNGDETCTADGTKTAKCDYCAVTDTKTDTGSMHPHTMTHTEAVEATCTSTGNVEYWHCSECEKNYDGENGGNVIADVVTEIDPDNHDLVHHEKKEPTYTESGWKAYDTCSRCDYTTYEELPKLTDDSKSTGETQVKEGTVNTGDNTQVGFWLTVFALSLSGMILIEIYRRKKKAE